MAVTLTIAGTSYSYPSGTDTEWGSDATPAMQAVVSNAIWKDGSIALTANWDVGSFQIRAETFKSDVATGTAPLIVASTTKVDNLQAALVEGTNVKSTGEGGGTKYLREDGDNSCSWQTVATGDKIAVSVFISGTSYVADGIVWARAPYAITLASCRVGVSTANTGAALIVDVEYSANDPTSTSSVFGTLPQIADGAGVWSGTSADIVTTAIAAGGFLKFNIDQIGSTIAGADLTIELLEA